MERGNRAFTFLEILIVIALIAVLCAAALPRASRQFAAIQLDSFSKRLLAICSYAAARAVIEQNTTLLTVDGRNNTVSLDVAGKRYKDFAIPDGISVEPGKPDAVFYPDGTNERFRLNVTGAYGRRTEVKAGNSYGGFRVEYPE